MNERDRLIELLQSVPSNHYGNIGVASVADHLIAHNVTIPPVSVGQTIYLIRKPIDRPAWIDECVLENVTVEYTADGKTCRFKSHNFEATEKDIGAWVFLAREEAEEAFREVKSWLKYAACAGEISTEEEVK